MFTQEIELGDFTAMRHESLRLMVLGTHRAVEEGLEAGVAHARREHPFRTRTGNLESGKHLYYRMLSTNVAGADGELVNDASYARFVEYPTKAHEIWPKEGHGFTGPLRPSQGRRSKTDIGTHRVALRFMIGSRIVFARMVHHPGTPGFPFMYPAAEVAADHVRFETEHVTFEIVSALWN